MLLAPALLVGCGSDSGSGSAPAPTGVAGPSEVSLEPVNSKGDNPFTPSVGRDRKKVKPPKAAAAGGRTTFSGSLPGLYGGTNNYSTCDTAQLVSFLQSDAAKATAWAQALNITPGDIPSFVDGLTPVLLRTDTRVTNHGYVNGVANPIPALLQAGTAVLVDRYGQPVVKCYCGNPLTVALPLAQPTYIGPAWRGFAPGQITIIQRSTTIINNYTLYDPDSGVLFKRPSGTSGGRDRPAQPTATATETETIQPPDVTITQPTQTAPPIATQTQARLNPAASFSPSAGTAADIYTLSVTGFEPDSTLTIHLTRPDGVKEEYTLYTAADSTGSFTFPHSGDPPLGTYTAQVVNPNTGTTASASVTVS